MMSRRKVSIENGHDTAGEETIRARQTALAEGYREMADDREREMEAEEWTEHILFDIE
jgi:hypothetical protein